MADITRQLFTSKNGTVLGVTVRTLSTGAQPSDITMTNLIAKESGTADIEGELRFYYDGNPLNEVVLYFSFVDDALSPLTITGKPRSKAHNAP